MRIAMIDPSLFTLPYDRALASGLIAGGHEVVLHGRHPRPAERLADDGAIEPRGDFYRISESPALRRAPALLRLSAKGVEHAAGLAGLLRRLRRAPPDVIHFQWLAMPLIDGALIGAFGAIAPLVLTVHDTNPFNGNPSFRLQSSGNTWAMRRFDAVIVHTRQGRQLLAQLGLSPARIAVVPHGLLTPLHAIRAPRRAGQEATFLLFGKMKPYKGIDLLLRAFAALPDASRLRACVRIVGQACMPIAPLQALADALGIAARVTIEDRFVDDEELPALFGPGTVAVFPYREIEASGVFGLAMAHGAPVIAARLGAFAETITDGIDGRLIPPDDVAALATALNEAILDPCRTGARGAALRETAASLPDWRAIACATHDVYASAAATRREAGAERGQEDARCQATP